MSNSIRKSLKNGKEGKGWEELVGYSVSELKNHLEKQFKNGLNWKKFFEEKYHIDHIKPKSLFNYNNYNDKEFKECWSLNNLQPLRSEDNLKKGNKYYGF